MHPVQLALLGAEALMLSLLVLGLFRARGQGGRSPLHVVLGGLVYLGASSTLRIEVAPGLAIQPVAPLTLGAVCMAVLLVHVADGVRPTGRLIRALALGNAGLSLVALVVGQHARMPGAVVAPALTPALLRDAALAVVQAAALYYLLVGVVLVFELLGRWSTVLLVRGVGALACGLAMHAAVFTLVGRWGQPDLKGAVLTATLAGLAAAAWFGAWTYGYVRGVEPTAHPSAGTGDVSDVWQELTYRQLYEQARSRLTRDSLTGVHNRGYLDEALGRAFADAVRQQQHLSVLIADADRFKDINDRYSHLMGDEVLKRFAGTLVEAARASDVVCRYGGDEFVVILPNATRANADAMAQRFQHRLRTRALAPPSGLAAIELSATIGIASLIEDELAAGTPDAVLRLADDRLLAGKRAGRGRVVADDGAVPHGS